MLEAIYQPHRKDPVEKKGDKSRALDEFQSTDVMGDNESFRACSRSVK